MHASPKICQAEEWYVGKRDELTVFARDDSIRFEKQNDIGF